MHAAWRRGRRIFRTAKRRGERRTSVSDEEEQALWQAQGPGDVVAVGEQLVILTHCASEAIAGAGSNRRKRGRGRRISARSQSIHAVPPTAAATTTFSSSSGSATRSSEQADSAPVVTTAQRSADARTCDEPRDGRVQRSCDVRVRDEAGGFSLDLRAGVGVERRQEEDPADGAAGQGAVLLRRGGVEGDGAAEGVPDEPDAAAEVEPPGERVGGVGGGGEEPADDVDERRDLLGELRAGEGEEEGEVRGEDGGAAAAARSSASSRSGSTQPTPGCPPTRPAAPPAARSRRRTSFASQRWMLLESQIPQNSRLGSAGATVAKPWEDMCSRTLRWKSGLPM